MYRASKESKPPPAFSQGPYQNDFAAGHLLAPVHRPSLPLLRDSNLENLDADPVPYQIDFEAPLTFFHESGTEKISRIKNINNIVLWKAGPTLVIKLSSEKSSM